MQGRPWASLYSGAHLTQWLDVTGDSVDTEILLAGAGTIDFAGVSVQGV
jgi:hypothetical protein